MIVSLKKRREFLALQGKNTAKDLGDLQSPKDFLISYKSPFFICHARQRQAGEYIDSKNRLGIVASKRIGGAVVRNRAKRRIRALWEGHNGLQECHSLDFVVIAYNTLPNGEFAQLQHEFNRAISYINHKHQTFLGKHNGK